MPASLVVLALVPGIGVVPCSQSASGAHAHAGQSDVAASDLEAGRLRNAAYAINAAGRHREALESFRKASRMAASAEMRVHNWAALIDPCIQVGLFGEAWQALEEARRSHASLVGSDRLSEMRLRMGEVRCFLGLGLIDQVHEPLERWSALVEQGPLEGEATWRLLLTLARMDWLNRTHRYAETIAWTGSLAPDLRRAAGVELRLGIAHWARGEDEKATHAFERVRAASGNDDALGMQVETRLAELYWDADREEEARSCVASAGARWAARTEHLAESFEDQLHLVAVQHRLGLVGSKDLERAFARFLESWEQAEPRPGGVPILGAMRQRLFLTELMEARIREQPGEAGLAAALDALCRLQELGGLARSLKGPRAEPWPSFADLRRSLTGERSGLLLYFSGRRKGLAFTVDAREIRQATIPGENELTLESRELIAWIAGGDRKSGKELERRGERLANLLFPSELRSQLEGWSEVGILGLGHLGALPFELLPLSGRRLEERMAVSRPLALPVLDLLRRRPDPRTRDWARDLVLLAAPPIDARGPDGRSANLLPLSFDDERRSALLGDLPSERVLALSGSAARLDGPGPELASARMLHVVTHGLSDERRERSATLLLAGADGRPAWIGCTELERLSLPPLVVLSACGSAQGPPRQGDEGVADLGGACLRAGAQVVLLAPYPIDYDDACVLSGLLVEELRAGRPPSTAVRAARLEFLARSEASDPTRALMQVVGLGTRPVF